MLHDKSFWVAVAFVIFIVMTFKFIKNAVFAALDNRSSIIAQDLKAAEELRKEAEVLLKSVKEKQNQLLKEAAEIKTHAEFEVKLMMENAEKELEESMKKKSELAIKRIEDQEIEARISLTQEAISSAIVEARAAILKELSANPAKFTKLEDSALADISKEL